jgi:hypothetical protein
MPTDYKCAECGLGFQVGWFHFHGPCEEYWAATLGFCRSCGTVHQLLHSSTDGPDQLISQAAPLNAVKSDLPGIDFRVPLAEWKDMEVVDRCTHCGTSGRICFDATTAVDTCPRCGSTSVAKGCTWMT